jgi:radical SAM superfamily enzyme YgiQ (UPF0313 family)
MTITMRDDKMKILLVAPPYHRLIGLHDSYLPLGLAALAAYLEQRGHTVRIYNTENCSEDLCLKWSDLHINNKLLHQHKYYGMILNNYDYYVWREIETVLREFSPDILGITTMTAKLASSWKIASIAKQVSPQCSVVLGGPHPTIAPESCFQSPAVDYVIRGEGEKTIEELSNLLQREELSRLDFIDGLSFRAGALIKHNKDRALTTDLDEFPMPARHLSLFPHLYDSNCMGHLTTSRGCPYLCGFCGAQNIWTRKVRYRSIPSVLQEIESMMEIHGIRSFYFWDDSFTVNKARLKRLCEEFLHRNYNISWGCTTRVDLIDPETLDVMVRAGCTSIDVGIESGSPRMLNQINKGITVEMAEVAIRLVRERGIACNAFFMIGFPQETEDDVRLTMDLMSSLEMSRICFSVFTPYPGCELYDTAAAMGLLNQNMDWSKYSHHSPNNHFIQNIPADVFANLLEECVELVDAKNNGGTVNEP